MTDTVSSPELVLKAAQSSGVDNPSAFLAANTGNSAFRVNGRAGAIVYRTAGAYLVQFGGAFAAADDQDALIEAFSGFAADQQRTIVSIQLQRADAERYARHGFTVNQVGASYAVDLNAFSLRGTRFMQLRNKISRAHRAGLVVVEADLEDWYEKMRDLDQSWLRSKGEHATELEFLVGQYGGDLQRYRRLFVGLIDGELAGYISYSPVYGSRPGWMHDLSRRRPTETPGLMEAINRSAIDVFRSEQVPWLHFGFTPFTGLDDASELPGHSPAFNRFMQLMWLYGEAAYPAQSQLAYKAKWAPDVVLPEYVAFQGPPSVAGFAHVFRACKAF
jgi:lysylphosphatidylglycerol synthetase-like protein (DUF2156 family)